MTASSFRPGAVKPVAEPRLTIAELLSLSMTHHARASIQAGWKPPAVAEGVDFRIVPHHRNGLPSEMCPQSSLRRDVHRTMWITFVDQSIQWHGKQCGKGFCIVRIL